MSESILNALMQLFALMAFTSGENTKGENVVAAFLEQHLSPRFVSDFLELFHNYLDFFNRDIHHSNTENSEGHTALLSYTDKVCLQIRKGLPQADRIIVYIKLLEYVIEDNIVTEVEKEVLDKISECFNIDESEAKDLKYFVFHTDCQEINPERLLTIENKQPFREDVLEGLWVEQNKPEWLEQQNSILNENIEGKLSLLYIASTGNFLLRYFGTAELYLDGMLIVSGVSYFVEVGAIIRGPSISPIYFNDLVTHVHKTSRRHNIVFTADEVEFYFRNSNTGVQKFSFSEESGQLIGIMGGSGVGKSTLLNLLTGKIAPKSGNVLINGYDIHNDKRAVEGIIGYVPQDDLLFEDLTVYQNLYYNAKLCFSNFTEFKIRYSVKQILVDLDLWEIRNLRVGSPLNKMISGGQRKRLNIGLELMREPGILFVDEPTSGLSSSDSLMVMRLLKEQANKGRLVIVNIHQPSSKVFRLLDKLWVLDKGGYPIYSGNPADAIVYFKTMSTQVNSTESGCPLCGTLNPDQILEIIEAKIVDENGKLTYQRQKTPKEWYELYHKHIQSKVVPKKHRDILPKNYFNIPNIEVQFKVFSIRNLLSKISNKQYVIINIIEAPLLAFILAYFTKYFVGNEYVFANNKNLPAYLFMSIVVAMFIGLIVSAEEIINDKKILERESFLNLSRFSYLNSKLFYLFALSALQMFLFVVVGNSILEIHGMTLNFWLILFSTACFANMVGLNISSGLNSVVSIYITIPFILVPQILLSGTIVRFDDLHPSLTKRIYTPAVGDVMVSRWAYEAMAVTQFKENAFDKHFFAFEQKISQSHFRSAFLVPRLQTLLEECTRMVVSEMVEKPKLERNLRIIRNELVELQELEVVPPFEFVDMLTLNDFTEEISDELTGYLFFIRMNLAEMGDVARQQKDSIYTNLVDSIGVDAVFRLQQQNHNKALADWVLNATEVNKYLETDSRVIQKLDPIYTNPSHNWGRAHFYAPFKKFNNQYVDTIWFNLAVIWMGSLALFVSLQMNLLGRFISYIENLRISKKTKKQEQVHGTLFVQNEQLN